MTAAAPMGPHDAARRHCRRLVRRQALKAAGVSALPMLGIDMVFNTQLLGRTIDEINRTHGLSPEQIAQLPPALRHRVDNMAADLGNYFIGRVITQGALVTMLRSLGLRLSAQQAAKLAPVAGLAASAALSGWMFKRLCDRHIDHCQRVRQALLELPGPHGPRRPFGDVIDMEST